MSTEAKINHAPLDEMFPIQGAPAIPWAVIAPCDRQCQRNHGRQTLKRIAERGGLGPSEACDVLLSQRWNTTPCEGATERLEAIVKERWYLPELARNRRLLEAGERLAELVKNRGPKCAFGLPNCQCSTCELHRGLAAYQELAKA